MGKLQKVEDLVDMTAMVDIVFFVLIFFMVTSMEGVYSSIKMPSPDPQKTASSGRRSVTDFESDKEYVDRSHRSRKHHLAQRQRNPRRTGASRSAARNAAQQLGPQPHARARQQRSQELARS